MDGHVESALSCEQMVVLMYICKKLKDEEAIARCMEGRRKRLNTLVAQKEKMKT
jgi:hypothetical protein